MSLALASSGVVGRYLLWDNGAASQGLFEHPLNEYKGIQVTRLIRLSYGPFQLGNLPRGAVDEVPKKVLAEQLGDAGRRR